MKYYKVSCEYYIRAKDEEKAKRLVGEDVSEPYEFLESHIIIDEVNKEIAEIKGVYNE